MALIVFLSSPGAGRSELSACGNIGSPPDEFHIFFSNQAGYLAGCDSKNRSGGEDSNITEWLKYFGLSKAYAGDVSSLIYEDNLNELKTGLSHLKSSDPDDAQAAIENVERLSNNAAYKKAVYAYKREALEYLVYAKECQKYSGFGRYSSWENSPPVPIEEMIVLEKRGLHKWKNTSDRVLKLRYAFQVIRLSHYRNDYQQTIKYFERLKPENISDLYYRTLSLYAGALRWTGSPEKARYLFALVAARSQSYVQSAMLDFEQIPQDRSRFQKTLSYARSKKEKLALFKVRSLLDDVVTLDDLKAARKIQASSGEFESIMLRQVALLEKHLLNRFLSKRNVYPWSRTYFMPAKKSKQNSHSLSNWTKQEAHSLSHLRGFIFGTLRKYKVCTPYVWRLAASYLAFLDEDYQGAAKNLAIASKLSKEGAASHYLHKEEEIRLMLDMITAGKLTAKKRAGFAKRLEKIYGKKKFQYNWHSYDSHMYALRVLKVSLMNHNQAGLALLISDWGRFNLEQYNERELTLMLQALEKKEKDKLDVYVIKRSGLDRKVVASRLASVLIINNKIKKAAALLTRIGVEPVRTYYVRTSSPFDEPSFRRRVIKEAKQWTKLKFARELKLLQNKAAKEKNYEKRAHYYMLLGNAWFNVSHFGSWWILAYDSKSAYSKYTGNSMLLKRAREAWRKSHSLYGNNKEKSVRALYFVTLAEQKIHGGLRLYYPKRVITESEKKLWRKMEQNYGGTEFFKTTVTECLYYRQFKKVQ